MNLNWPKCASINIYKTNAGYFCRVTFDDKIETVTKTKIKLKGVIGGPSRYESQAEIDAFKAMKSILGFHNVPSEQNFLFEYLKEKLQDDYLVDSDYKFLANRKYEIDIAIRKKDVYDKGIGIEVNGGFMFQKSGHSSANVIKDYKKYEIMILNRWLPYLITPEQAKKDYEKIARNVKEILEIWI